jgi:hypothetical protein
MKATIKQLRQSGFKARVMHTRNTVKVSKGFSIVDEISNFGGLTKIELTTPDMEVTVVGEAVCSNKDMFNRRIGNEVALGRALASLKELTGDKYAL